VHTSGQGRGACLRHAAPSPRACAQTVNAVLEDGRTVGVQAQQYAVLVMDVPDLRAEAEKRALAAALSICLLLARRTRLLCFFRVTSQLSVTLPHKHMRGTHKFFRWTRRA